ncbi:MAG: cation:proton antiporter, partial [Acidobacteriota bacterium]|nr:cation:proton antiporter [Acidobacteriota bacterium]
MGMFEMVTVLVVLAAVLSFVNHRFLGLPTTIGVMLIAMAISLVLIGLGQLGLGIERQAEVFLARIQFKDALLHGMLAFLLFAGALHVDIGYLARQKWVIATLVTLGVLMSTALVGLSVFLLFGWLGFSVGLLSCLLFGA